ncbi:uncharacterized protein [Dysidea avara]|uniref:uncharacterized protein n=1 Tax=Dysidea avara TaxID=196820 RepID=UPI00332435FA
MANETRSDTDKEYPDLKQLVNVLKPTTSGVATRWYDIGIQLLDSDVGVLDVIKQNNPQDTEACCRDMLKEWLRRQPNASWDQLVLALGNVDMNVVADQVKTVLHQDSALTVSVAITNTSSVIMTPGQAATEFAILMAKLIKELQHNEHENLEDIKSICSFLTIGRNSDKPLFNDDQHKAIEACKELKTLFRNAFRHCWKWNNITTLKMIIQSLDSDKCMELIDQYENKIDARMKLEHIYEHYKKEDLTPPEEYHKMVAIISNKVFSTITKEEYDDLRQFTAEYCGVYPCVMSLSNVSPFNSLLLEWFISSNAVQYMVEISKRNVVNFTNAAFVFLKISSTVIFDHRSNEEECQQLLSAARTGDTVTVERLLHIRYVNVNTSDPLPPCASKQA